MCLAKLASITEFRNVGRHVTLFQPDYFEDDGRRMLSTVKEMSALLFSLKLLRCGEYWARIERMARRGGSSSANSMHKSK
jgi:hypothetical protein